MIDRDTKGRFTKNGNGKNKNVRWNNGQTVTRGYVFVYLPQHPRANSKGYVQRSRLVWFESTGVWPDGLHVHHKNRIKSDDRFENLELLDEVAHAKEHTFWPKFCMSCGKDGKVKSRGLCGSCYDKERKNETLSFWSKSPIG